MANLFSNKLPVFDYDATLVTDKHIPERESVLRLVASIREMYRCPLVIFTAGTVNCPDDKYYKNNAMRPISLMKLCNLKYSVNRFDPYADACVFGRVIGSHMCQNTDIVYRKILADMYVPMYMIGNYNYSLINRDGEKKMSVLYHHINRYKLDPCIMFVDDMPYHDMSGLDNMVADPFECTNSCYYQINPITTQKDANRRCESLRMQIDQNLLDEYLSVNSKNVWKRW